MADLAQEASRREDWLRPAQEEGGAPEFDIEGFLDQHLDFGGREFEVVLLWTTLDYLPGELIVPTIQRLHQSVRPGGRVLAFFHSKATGPETGFYRYHVTDKDNVEMQEAQKFPIRQVYTNRQIEKLFAGYQDFKFFLAKDNVYEVIITR